MRELTTIIISTAGLLFLPGYFFIAASFPKSEWPERTVLSFTLSLSLMSISSIFADWLGFALGPGDTAALAVGWASVGGIIFSRKSRHREPRRKV